MANAEPDRLGRAPWFEKGTRGQILKQVNLNVLCTPLGEQHGSLLLLKSFLTLAQDGAFWRQSAVLNIYIYTHIHNAYVHEHVSAHNQLTRVRVFEEKETNSSFLPALLYLLKGFGVSIASAFTVIITTTLYLQAQGCILCASSCCPVCLSNGSCWLSRGSSTHFPQTTPHFPPN